MVSFRNEEHALSAFPASGSFFEPWDVDQFPEPGEPGGRREIPEPRLPVVRLYGLDHVNSCSSGKDKGSNDWLARRFAKCKRHKTIDQASANLRRGLPPVKRAINICGHGNLGQLEFGAGQRPGNSTNELSNWNWPWPASVSQLGRGYEGVIRIYSCRTGGGSEGARFCWHFAQATGHKVMAYSGDLIVYSDRHKLEFQKGGAWQTARPGMESPPDPIKPPPLPRHKPLLAHTVSAAIGFSMANVRAVEARTQSAEKAITRRGSMAEAASLAMHLFGATRLPAGAQVPGIVTAQLTFEFEDGLPVEVTIIADTVADFGEGGMYLVDEEFELAFDQLVAI